MRLWFVVVLASCQMEAAPVTGPAAPTPAPTPRDAPSDPALAVVVDAAMPAAPTVPEIQCMTGERQWGTTCCRIQGEPGRRHWMSCRGPQLGKACHRKGDCDITCGCDPALVHQDGKTGVTGTCTGFMPSGEWLCTLDEAGKVSSLIID